MLKMALSNPPYRAMADMNMGFAITANTAETLHHHQPLANLAVPSVANKIRREKVAPQCIDGPCWASALA
tara:strand:- start:3016 stop:3225 length:210 start_codon:yes stop_codon:yes gene_type:complete